MDAIAEPAFEAVPVEQRHEELKVLFLAVVRRRGHQQEVPGQPRQQLAELVALCFFDLAAEDRWRDILWASSTTTRSQSVARSLAWRSSLRESLSSRQIASGFSENQLPVRAASSLSLVMISNGKWKRRSSSSCHCSTSIAGADDQAALQVPSDHQLLDQQAGHDRLAGAGIVGQEKPQRLAGEASRHRRPVIWWGSGSTSEVWTASTGSNR